MLKGTVILVTGASQGIGREIAVKAAVAGARVIIAARNSEKLESVANHIAQLGGDCLGIVTDVASEASVRSLFEEIDVKYGSLDVLVNNAAICAFGSVEQLGISDWNSIIDTNLKGPFLLSKAGIPLMRRHGGGHIIMIASQAGLSGMPNLTAYCASKFGLVGFSQSLGKELRPDRIRVSYLCPGWVDTDMLQVFPASIVRDAKKAG